VRVAVEVIDVVAVSPAEIEAVAELIVSVSPTVAAEEVGDDIIPNPKATTTASEIRLKYVFVDIDFLS
jgi:hypothetical protein